MPIAFLFAFLPLVSAQDSGNDQGPGIITQFDDAPLYVTAGLQYGSYYGPEFNRNFPYKLTTEFGFWFEYSLFQQFPFYSGLEWQWRGYNIDNEKRGTNQNGMEFIQKVKGKVDIQYLTVPFLFRFPAGKPEKKFQFLLGLNTSLRFLYKDNYCADYQIPEIGFTFDSCYSKFRNDAMDFIDFHGVAGAIYRLHPKVSVLFLGSYKLGGFSISKENFLTRRELNTNFSIKVLWQIWELRKLPFI